VNEVSARLVKLAVDAARKNGVDVRPALAVSGIPDPARVSCRVDWDQYVLLLEQLEIDCGGPERATELGELDLHLSPEIRMLAGAFVSPRQLYRFLYQTVAKVEFPHLIFEWRELDDDHVWRRVEIPPPYRPCETFFRGTEGSHRGASRMLGVDGTLVISEITPRVGIYRMKLPPSNTLWAKLGRTGRTVARAAVKQYERQQIDFASTFDALERTRRAIALTEELSAASSLSEIATVVGRALVDRLGYQRIELWVRAEGDEEALVVELGGSAEPLRHFVLQSNGRCVGHLAVAGSSIDDDPLSRILPVLATAIDRVTARPSVEPNLDIDSLELTPKQSQVVKLLLGGLSNKEIAVKLGISVRTVEVHVTEVLRKAEVSSRAQLVSRVLRGRRARK
jgi:DNA-binding CsgD family transcriptional regulator